MCDSDSHLVHFINFMELKQLRSLEELILNFVFSHLFFLFMEWCSVQLFPKLPPNNAFLSEICIYSTAFSSIKCQRTSGVNPETWPTRLFFRSKWIFLFKFTYLNQGCHTYNLQNHVLWPVRLAEGSKNCGQSKQGWDLLPKFRHAALLGMQVGSGGNWQLHYCLPLPPFAPLLTLPPHLDPSYKEHHSLDLAQKARWVWHPGYKSILNTIF